MPCFVQLIVTFGIEYMFFYFIDNENEILRLSFYLLNYFYMFLLHVHFQGIVFLILICRIFTLILN